MVRKITGAILVSLFFFIIQVKAQNSVGIGTPTPNPKAVLELVSPGNNQGLLVPKLTTTQRTATSFTNSLTAQENGLLVFDSDDQKFYYWQTSQWLPIRSGSDSALTSGTGVTITGNTISAIPDGDGSATNELQELVLTGNTLRITGSPTSATIDLSSLVLANETQNLQLTGNTLKITGNPAATPIDLSTLNLADNSATNEIQDLQLVGSTLTITNNAAATPINLSAFTGTDTDQQALSYNATNGDLSITRLSGPPQTITITTAGAAGGDLTGTYPNPTIGTGKVTSAGILDGTIATADLANTSVTDAKVATGISVSKVTAGTNGQFLSTVTGVPTWTTLTSLPPNGAAGGDLTGSFPNPTINANAVTSAKILDGTIINADIASVDASKITSGILPLTVGGTGATTAAGARTNFGLGSLATLSAITTTEITDGTIATADLANTSVTDAKIATGVAVSKITAGTNGQFLSTVTGVPTWTTLTSLPPTGTAGGDLTGSFPNPTINLNAITSAKILDGTIVDADIATVDALKITSGTLPVTRGGSGIAAVTPGAVAYGGVTNFAFTSVGIAGQLLQSNGAAAPTWVNSPTASGTAGGDLTGSYPNPTIGTGKVTSTSILDGTIVNADIANVDASKISGTLPLANGGTGATTAAGARTNLGLGALATLSTVTTTEITDGTIATADLANTSVTDTKIASGITPSKVTPSATNNQVLTTVAGVTSWANLPAFGTGSVTSIATGTGLTGGPITTTGTIALNNTGVGAATYGSATQVPVLTVDLQGRITAASTATVTAATSNLSAVLTAGNNAGGTKITNLGAPTVTTDATTKLYVDNLDAADLDKSSSNEIQDLKSVVAQGNDANGSSIVNVGALGIGTSNPKTNLSVIGSQSISFTAKTGSYTIQKDDYLIISNGAGAVVTLPPAAEVPGRVLIIRTLDNDKGLDVRPNTGDNIDGATLIKLFDVNGQVNAITVVADGKDKWWIVSNSVK